jgi:hypothetical protein
MKLPGPKTRLWIYNVLNAGVAVAVGYGVFTGQEAALWGLVINAVLGMAANKVPEANDA